MTVADTDVLIDFLADREPASRWVAGELEGGRLWTTVITRFELLCGARNARQEIALRRLLAAIPSLSLDQQAADQAARVRKSLEKAGEPIGMADSLIAGIVLSQNATLLTRNRRHFKRVSGLRLAELSSSQ